MINMLVSSQPVVEIPRTSTRGSRLAVVAVTMAMQAVVATIGASPAFANYPYFVNSLADTASSDGVCTLREAMFAANNNPINGDCGPGSPEFDTIFIFVPGTIVLEGKLPNITEGVAILGHASGGTTIDGNSRVRPFVISGSGQLSSVIVRLEKLTITNAKAPSGNVASPRGEDGGAIHNTAQLYLTDVRITHSEAGNGGAGVGEGGHGGAIYNAGLIVAYRVTFDHNSSGNGVEVPGDVGFPVTITRPGIGGAIYNAPGAGLIVYAGTFTGNSGRTASVLYTLGPAIIKSSTFANSYATYEAAIVTDGPGQVLLSSTIIDTVYDCKALVSPGQLH